MTNTSLPTGKEIHPTDWQLSDEMKKALTERLCVHKKYVVKAVLMELRCKCQIIPPVVFISDDIGSHDFIYRPQAFIISQRYLTSFLYW